MQIDSKLLKLNTIQGSFPLFVRIYFKTICIPFSELQ